MKLAERRPGAEEVIEVTRVGKSRHGCLAAFPHANQPIMYAFRAGHDTHPRRCEESLGPVGSVESMDRWSSVESMDKNARKVYLLLQEAGDWEVRHLWTSVELIGCPFQFFCTPTVPGCTILLLFVTLPLWFLPQPYSSLGRTIWLLSCWWFFLARLCWRCCSDRELALKQAELRQSQSAPTTPALLLGQPTQQQHMDVEAPPAQI